MRCRGTRARRLPSRRVTQAAVIDVVLATIRDEFSDLVDVEQFTRVALRLLVAMLLGAVIGWDRQRRDADAGLRTHMLVALGAALFVVVAVEGDMSKSDQSRVLQGIVSGIGFLGAGAVLKDSTEGRIHGLTTAASIWATAALGIAAGMGREATALLATVLVLAVLDLMRRLSRRIRPRHD